MVHIGFKIFKYFFHSACWLSTAILLCYWIYLFYLDDDICLVDYKKYYYTPDHGFPKLSFCLKNPFLKTRLRSNGFEVNVEQYSDFLKGLNFSSGSLKINYSDAVLDASKYVDRYWIEWRNGSREIVRITSEDNNILVATYSFFWDLMFYSCYSLQAPEDRNLNAIAILIKNSIFPGSVRTNDQQFITFLHTKNQLLTSGTLKYAYPRREANYDYTLRYKVKGVEFIRRRNKKKQPCFEDWTNYDEEILRRHVMKSGCSPPYFIHNFDVPACSTKDQIAASLFSLRFDDYDIQPPCQAMERIDYIFEDHVWEEKEIWWNKTSEEGSFWFGLYIYNQKFKEIEQIKAIDVNGLIGYIGGYIGLILGYSILQIPEYVGMLARKFNGVCLSDSKQRGISSPIFIKNMQPQNHFHEPNMTIEKEFRQIYQELKLIMEAQNRSKNAC